MPERSSDLPRVTQLSDKAQEGEGEKGNPDSLLIVQYVFCCWKVKLSIVKSCSESHIYLSESAEIGLFQSSVGQISPRLLKR